MSARSGGTTVGVKAPQGSLARSGPCALLLLAMVLLPLALTACHRKSPPPSGGGVDKLKVIDQKVGDGPVAKPGMELVVQYTGWLYDPHATDKRGKEFDSTARHDNTPFHFVLGTGHVIQGWNKGMQGMRVGGVRILMIPPDLAYGDRAVGGGTIPAHSSLVFRVKLLAARTP